MDPDIQYPIAKIKLSIFDDIDFQKNHFTMLTDYQVNHPHALQIFDYWPCLILLEKMFYDIDFIAIEIALRLRRIQCTCTGEFHEIGQAFSSA